MYKKGFSLSLVLHYLATGLERFELSISAVTVLRDNHLHYSPIKSVVSRQPQLNNLVVERGMLPYPLAMSFLQLA